MNGKYFFRIVFFYVLGSRGIEKNEWFLLFGSLWKKLSWWLNYIVMGAVVVVDGGLGVCCGWGMLRLVVRGRL